MMTLSHVELKNLIRTRRSIRRYLNKPVSPELISEILENAAWAPSSHNRQPWRFQIITEDFLKIKLATTMGNKLYYDRTQDNDPIELIEQDVARSYQRITNAPIIIMVFLTLVEMDQYRDQKRNQLEYLMAVQSTAMAVQNVLLSIHALNLGGCWMCAPLFCPEEVMQILNVPQHWQPQAMITLGFPENNGKPAIRKSLAELTTE